MRVADCAGRVSGLQAAALANLSSGYRVDLCVEARRNLTATAHAYLEGGRFDARRVGLTKHLTAAEARRLQRAKQQQQSLPTAAAAAGGAASAGRQPPAPRGAAARRGGAAGQQVLPEKSQSLAYNMAVDYKVRVMDD